MYPPVHVEAVRHPRVDGALGTILVKIRDDDSPYLVTKMPTDENRYPSRTAFGWPRRQGPHTAWTPIGQVHRHLRAQPPAMRPTDQKASQVSQPSADPVELVKSLESSMGWDDHAILYVGAAPDDTQPVPIPGFYDEQQGVVHAVRQPFELRWAGFGITYGHGIEIDESGAIVSNDDERALVVYPNGVAIAALSTGGHFLTRGGGTRDPVQPEPRIMNPIVVTEWTYLFCRFVARSLAPSTAGRWHRWIGLRGAKTRPWALRARPGRNWIDPGGWLLARGDHESGMDNWHSSIEADLDPDRDGYRLLGSLYELFGLKFDDVGLAKDGRIDEAAIRALS